MFEGFDAASRLSGAAVAAAGRAFVCRYVGAYAGDWRETSAAEISDLLAHNVAVVLNYEGSGTDARSFANGAADARYADSRVNALGHPGAVIYFSIDEQTAPDPVGYFQGVESVIGHSRTGVYGGYDTVTALHNAGVCAWFWMTYAWEYGRPVPSFVHIYQYRNGQTVNGMTVDFDRALTPNFGQIGVQLAGGNPRPFTPPIPKEDHIMAISFGHRTQAGYPDEWMIVHPDLDGGDGKQLGYLVTTDQAEALAWSRLFHNGWADTLTGPGGRYEFDVNRQDYIEIQTTATRIHNATKAAS